MSPEGKDNAALIMDTGLPLGNSLDVFLRRALHVKIGNGLDEPVPVNVESSAVLGATKVTIYNVSAPSAGTEYSQALSTGTQAIYVRARKVSQLRVAFTAGGTSVNWETIPPGNRWPLTGLSLTSKTIYFQASRDGETVEITELS